MRALKIKCQYCNFEKILDKNMFLELFKTELKITNANKNYYGLTCSSCFQKNPYIYAIFSDFEELIIDPKNLNNCKHCECPITIQRIKAQKDTNICSSSCINEIEENSSYRPDIMPDRPVPDNKKTCPVCYSKNICVFDYKKKYYVVKCPKSECNYREKIS